MSAKAWEETWELSSLGSKHGPRRYIIVFDKEGAAALSPESHAMPASIERVRAAMPARAKLAAAAPEMARLLMEVEWSGCWPEPYDGCDRACPVCGQKMPHPDGRVEGLDYGHKDDCRLLAVLRKAGCAP